MCPDDRTMRLSCKALCCVSFLVRDAEHERWRRDNGVPSGGLFTGAEVLKTPDQVNTYGGLQGAQLDPCYHQACDTWPANINTDVLFGNARALAYSMEKLATHANARKWLYPGNATIANNRVLGRESADLHFYGLL
jgi:hypothetical protein